MFAITVVLSACSSTRDEQADGASPTSAATATTAATTAATTTAIAVSDATAPTVPTSTSVTPTTGPASTTGPTTAVAPTTTTVESTTTVAPTTTIVPTTTLPSTTPYGMPVADGAHAGYSRQHHDYPASDVFVPGGCGSPIISPVNGTVLESRRDDAWVSGVDNPATRGGKSIAILGDDGVRYYLAHFDSIAADIEPGVRVEIGHPLGLMGRTGRAGACHVHFAISPPCPGKEWAVRRGVIWPWGYLDAWRAGEQASPVAEVEQWVLDHPNACAEAMADPNAAES